MITFLLWKRALSTCLDAGIVLLIGITLIGVSLTPLCALDLIQWLLLNLWISWYDVPTLIQKATSSFQYGPNLLAGLFADTVFAGYVLMAVLLVLCWLYFAGFEASRRQATPGKMVLGLMVTGLNTYRVSFIRTSLRYWILVIPALIMMLTIRLGWLPEFVLVLAGNLLPARFSKSGRALNDRLTGSLVR